MRAQLFSQNSSPPKNRPRNTQEHTPKNHPRQQQDRHASGEHVADSKFGQHFAWAIQGPRRPKNGPRTQIPQHARHRSDTESEHTTSLRPCLGLTGCTTPHRKSFGPNTRTTNTISLSLFRWSFIHMILRNTKQETTLGKGVSSLGRWAQPISCNEARPAMPLPASLAASSRVFAWLMNKGQNKFHLYAMFPGCASPRSVVPSVAPTPCPLCSACLASSVPEVCGPTPQAQPPASRHRGATSDVSTRRVSSSTQQGATGQAAGAPFEGCRRPDRRKSGARTRSAWRRARLWAESLGGGCRGARAALGGGLVLWAYFSASMRFTRVLSAIMPGLLRKSASGALCAGWPADTGPRSRPRAGQI